jgi:hypothetical protein
MSAELLTLVADGEGVPSELATQLAEAVLARPEVRMAVEILQGGQHSRRRAIELARVLFEEGIPQVVTSRIQPE